MPLLAKGSFQRGADGFHEKENGSTDFSGTLILFSPRRVKMNTQSGWLISRFISPKLVFFHLVSHNPWKKAGKDSQKGFETLKYSLQ